MGSSEKFCLKWKDFQQNVSKSFSQLRQQSGLFDVTLVSSDQQQVSAHRLVLSACSDFFKTIFHSNTHSHPLLYLDGVDTREINLMLDYIYQGEVQIYQENLDRFLEIAKKFNLDGLVAEEKDTFKEEYPHAEITNYQENEYESVTQPNQVYHPHSKPIIEKSLKVLSQNIEAQNSEVHEKFEELVVKENGLWRCTVCDKTMKLRKDMRRHLETHLEGLSYDCQHCGKTFRSVNALRQHKCRNKL